MRQEDKIIWPFDGSAPLRNTSGQNRWSSRARDVPTAIESFIEPFRQLGIELKWGIRPGSLALRYRCEAEGARRR